MKLPPDCHLLRIYTEERARGEHRALFEEIVVKARDSGLAGATVLRGPLGYGGSARLHNASILDLSSNLPIVIEIVDTEVKLRDFVASMSGLSQTGLITLEKVEVLHAL